MVPPERSGSDLLIQSAGLLILWHTREETTEPSTEIPVDAFVAGRVIRRIRLIQLIVRTVKMRVKQAVTVRESSLPAPYIRGRRGVILAFARALQSRARTL